MKAKIYSFIIVLFVTVTVAAQSNRIIDSKEYDQLKRANQLPEKFMMKQTEGKTILMPRIHPSANTIQSNATCNCLLPLDTTYSVVPFTNGVAPDFRNDDGSSPVMAIPFSFCFFGQPVDSLYINNNGNISFYAPYFTFTPSGFPSASFAMIAPFWADVDTRDTLSGLVYYKVTPTALIVKWEQVGYFNMHSNLVSTFQLIITDGTDPLIPGGSNVAFCYGDMQWTTGDASGGVGGFGGTAATVGSNLGDAINFIQFGRFDQPGYGYDGPYLANDSVDWLDSSSFRFDLCTMTIAPVPFDCNNDTVYLRVGDASDVDVSFICPVAGQTASISVNSGGLSNLTTFSNTSGSLARYNGRLIADAADIGNHTFTLTVTDNGTPPQTTTFNRVFQVDQALGIQPADAGPSISFSPNPFTNQTTLILSGVNRKNVSLVISDVTGREVMTVNHVPSSLIIEKGNLPKGIYFYHLGDGDGLSKTGKIVIQ
ncbi:MAG: T9SS type A sorting domain-containing protein [Bacteroidetes bacterium]|nr:T9SS type A sorting domain-containing protein [Bacteroidota bacterium]